MTDKQIEKINNEHEELEKEQNQMFAEALNERERNIQLTLIEEIRENIGNIIERRIRIRKNFLKLEISKNKEIAGMLIEEYDGLWSEIKDFLSQKEKELNKE